MIDDTMTIIVFNGMVVLYEDISCLDMSINGPFFLVLSFYQSWRHVMVLLLLIYDQLVLTIYHIDN